MKSIINILLLATIVTGTNITYLFAGHSNMNLFLLGGGAWLFESNMAILYPEHKFKVVRCDFPRITLEDMKRSEHRFESFLKRIKQARDTSTIAGAVLMYGYVDGLWDSTTVTFAQNFQLFVSELRVAAGNSTLPIFIDRNENNCTHKSKNIRVIDSIKNELPKMMSHVYLFPISDMPQQRYKPNDHHYDSIGYKIVAYQIPAMIQIYGEDWWNK